MSSIGVKLAHLPPSLSLKSHLRLELSSGGRVEIRNYKGKTMREAAEQMRRLDCAKVWEMGESERGRNL